MADIHRLAAVLAAGNGSDNLRHNRAGNLEALRAFNQLAVHNRAAIQHIADINQAAVKNRLNEIIRVMEMDQPLLMGIISAVAGAALFFGAPFAEGVIEDGPAIARMFGIIIAVIGVFQLIAGIIGMRAAKRDNLLKPFTYLCAFIIVVCLAEVGMSFTSGEEMGPVWPYLIYAAVCFSGVVFAGRALKENGAA